MNIIQTLGLWTILFGWLFVEWVWGVTQLKVWTEKAKKKLAEFESKPDDALFGPLANIAAKLTAFAHKVERRAEAAVAYGVTGTAVGILYSLTTLSSAEMGAPGDGLDWLLSSGIGSALLTTAVGLAMSQILARFHEDPMLEADHHNDTIDRLLQAKAGDDVARARAAGEDREARESSHGAA